ncbi:MAG: hypothetical protein L0099_14335 [Acidobacteria bacterium]|nr:hypothetical protein [Acidobacteriota bacterium]
MARAFNGLMIAAGLAAGVLGLPANATEASGKPTAVSVTKTKAKSKKPPETVVAQAPPARLLPYQLPAKPPTVSFRNGQLAIEAENATLAAVMEQVRIATNAAVEAGPYFGGERVSVHLGPGAPRDVVAELLNGSNYNFILLGSLRDPQALERVIVTQRSAAAPDTTAAPRTVLTFPVTALPAPQPLPDEEPEAEEVQEEPQPIPSEIEPPTEQTTPQPGRPGGPLGTPNQPPQVKTPQELLQELQERLRRQQEEQSERNEQQRQQLEEEEQPK